MSASKRRFPRYPANLRLRLHLPSGEIETTTDEVSLAGFSAPCAPAPDVGTRFGFVLHLPDGRMLSGEVSCAWSTPDAVAGFETAFSPAHQPEWAAFIEQEANSGGLWRMIGRYAVNQGQEREAARSVLERGRLGVLFKRLGASPAETEDAPVVTRLHMVGENAEAYRVAFEKHPGIKVDDCELFLSPPEFLELARAAVVRVLPQDVYLKRSPQAKIAPSRVVELRKGGFAVVALHANGARSLAGLHGAELLAVEIDGKSVFPFFEPADLDRIALDTFRRDPLPAAPAEPAAPGPTVQTERFARSYAHRDLATRQLAPSSPADLREAMGAARRVQTRSYGNRTIRLFPELWLEVQRPQAWSGPVRGFAMEDGLNLCVFVLVGPDAPRVVALEPTDGISIIRGDAQS